MSHRGRKTNWVGLWAAWVLLLDLILFLHDSILYLLIYIFKMAFYPCICIAVVSHHKRRGLAAPIIAIIK